MNLRLTNRIALFNTVAAAITMLLVFSAVYSTVYITSYRHMDSDIREEMEEIFSQITTRDDSIILSLNTEWEEREHNQAEVNPTFFQIVNGQGRVVIHSRNLQNDHLLYATSLNSERFFNVEFNGKRLRQGQFPIKNKSGKIIGQLDVGVSQEESVLILSNLRSTFFIAFPLMLLLFYFVTSLAASRSIAPLKKLIEITGKMGYNNMSARLPMPQHHDEIFQLSTTINSLLEKIEVGLIREKQITADISHELRTPLTGIKGTLEVLIRKTRDSQQYENKIRQVIQEVDYMNRTIDELLHLARLDSGNVTLQKAPLLIHELLLKVKNRWLYRFGGKNISMEIDVDSEEMVHADYASLEIIIDNLISNAFKYGYVDGRISCLWNSSERKLIIKDNGPGISQEHIPYIFNRFYKANNPDNPSVQSIGLGLYIVKTLADLQEITIEVESEVNKGTSFSLCFLSKILS